MVVEYEQQFVSVDNDLSRQLDSFDMIWNYVWYGIIGFFAALIFTSLGVCVSAGIVSWFKKETPRKHQIKFKRLCCTWVC